MNHNVAVEDVILLLKTIEEDVEQYIPTLFCDNCGGTDCDSEDHLELEGNPSEKWCNKCSDNSGVWELHESVKNRFSDLSEILTDLETRVREEEHTNLVNEIKWWLFEYGKFDNEDLLNFKKQFELSQKGTDDKTD